MPSPLLVELLRSRTVTQQREEGDAWTERRASLVAATGSLSVAGLLLLLRRALLARRRQSPSVGYTIGSALAATTAALAVRQWLQQQDECRDSSLRRDLQQEAALLLQHLEQRAAASGSVDVSTQTDAPVSFPPAASAMRPPPLPTHGALQPPPLVGAAPPPPPPPPLMPPPRARAQHPGVAMLPSAAELANGIAGLRATMQDAATQRSRREHPSRPALSAPPLEP